MNVYVSNILFAALSFPLIAFFITLPYMIYQYRRFGSIPWLRTLVVYSFAFYLLCAYFLVLLPLPEDRSAVVPYAQTPQLVPFNFVHGFLAETTFSPSDPSTWLAALRDPYVYEAFFNVLLLVPLGMYLRYYFRRTWWQTLAIGFLVTLSFETTQLTGLWGLYEHPYRLFDVDDLMLNTLGAMIGFWTVGPAMRVLPDIRLVNEEAREAGMRASVTKRALSFFIDLAIALAAAGAATAAAEALGARAAVEAAGASWGTAVQVADAVSFAAFFALVPALTRGQTLAQKLLRLRIVRTDATPAHWYQYLARYGLLALFGWAPFALLFGVLDLDAAQVGEMNALAAFAAEHRAAVVGAWTAFMTAWAVSLAVRAVQAGARKRSFVMLNGVLSGTRVMTEAGVELARERRGVLDVDEVAALERAVAEDGTPLAELMDRAGRAVADEVRAWVPDPAPVVVLSGSGNNGGDGWVAARVLAEARLPRDAGRPRPGRAPACRTGALHGVGNVRPSRRGRPSAVRAHRTRRRRAGRCRRRSRGRGGRAAGHRFLRRRGTRAVRRLDTGRQPPALRGEARQGPRAASQAHARARRARTAAALAACEGQGRPVRRGGRRPQRPLGANRSRGAADVRRRCYRDDARLQAGPRRFRGRPMGRRREAGEARRGRVEVLGSRRAGVKKPPLGWGDPREAMQCAQRRRGKVRMLTARRRFERE